MCLVLYFVGGEQDVGQYRPLRIIHTGRYASQGSKRTAKRLRCKWGLFVAECLSRHMK